MSKIIPAELSSRDTPSADGVLARAGDASQDPARLFILEHSTSKSRETIVDCLRRIARAVDAPSWETIPWARLTNKETTLIRTFLLERPFPRRGDEPARLNPRTVKMTLSTLRGVIRKAFDLGQITADQRDRATSWPKIRAYTIPVGRMLEDEEIEAIFASVDREVDPYRALLRGVLAVLLGAGARREEAANLPVDALANRRLRITGKGRREREVLLPPAAAKDLHRWLQVRGKLHVTVGTMFVIIDGAGRPRNRSLSLWSMWSLICGMCEEAGVEDVTPHDFRRTFASKLLAQGVDLATVQRLMGHADPSTTVGYDRRGQKAVDKAMEVLEEWWP